MQNSVNKVKNIVVKIELSSINEIKFCGGNSNSLRDDPYWTSMENSLKLMELSSINSVG